MAGPKSRTRPPSVRSPGALPGSLILARLRGRSGAADPRPPRPLPSGPRPPPAPPANFPLPASCPASPFPRPGAAPHGHKGRAAGQERRDAAWNAAPEPDKVVGGGGGNRRLAGAKMLWRSVLTVGHNDCPIPLSGEKLTWNRPFFKPGVYVCLRVFSCPQREEEMGGRQTPARRSPLQACQPCNLLLTKILHTASCFSNSESPSFPESLSCSGMCVYIPGRGRGKNYMPQEERSGRPNNCTLMYSLSAVLPKDLPSNRRKTWHYIPLLHLQTSGYPTFPAGPSKSTHQHALIKCLQAPKSNTGEAFCINLLFLDTVFSVPCAQLLYSPDTSFSFT